MINKAVILTSILLALMALQRPQERLSQNFQVSGYYSSMKIDEHGRIFLISGSTLHLYEPSGHLIATRKFDQGVPSSIGISAGNEVFFYNTDSAQMEVASSNLAGKRKMSLKDAGIKNPGVACLGEHEQIWVYDKDREKFLLLDHNMKVRRKSEALGNFASHGVNPISVTWYDQYLLINNGGHEVLVLNQFGSFHQRLSVRTRGNIQIADNKVYFIQYGSPMMAELETGRPEHVRIPFNFSNVREFLIRDNRLYVLTHGGFRVFNL